jgi:hypothetical protein
MAAAGRAIFRLTKLREAQATRERFFKASLSTVRQDAETIAIEDARIAGFVEAMHYLDALLSDEERAQVESLAHK